MLQTPAELRGADNADNYARQQIQTTQSALSKVLNVFQSFVNRMVYSLVNSGCVLSFGLWTCLTWAVVKLYVLMGTFLIPLWDWTHAGSLTLGGVSFGEGYTLSNNVLPGSLTGSAVAGMVKGFGAFFWALSGALIPLLVYLGVTNASWEGKPVILPYRRALIALTFAVAFPLTYSVMILSGGLIGNSMIAYATQQRVIGGNDDAGLFQALISADIFTVGANNRGGGTPGGLNPGVTNVISGGSSSFSGPVTAPDGGGTTAQDQQIADCGQNAVLVDPLQNPNAVFQMIFDCPGTGLDYAKKYVTGSIALSVSRLVQIVLCLFALWELIMLLGLKGGQIVSSLYNYYLGIVSVSMLANDSTKSVFWGWFRAHLALCLWSPFWALLIVTIHLAAKGASCLHSVSGTMNLGAFLFPFMLFATFRKFHEISRLAGDFTSTSGMAASIGQAVGGQVRQVGGMGFKAGKGALKASETARVAGNAATLKTAAAAAATGGTSTVALTATEIFTRKMMQQQYGLGEAKDPSGKGPSDALLRQNRDMAARQAIASKAGMGTGSGPGARGSGAGGNAEVLRRKPWLAKPSSQWTKEDHIKDMGSDG
jgi:hypothetical protein